MVKGQTDNFSLKMSIANLCTLVFLAKYSVIPGSFLSKKFFFEIGPLINLFELNILRVLRPISKES